MFQSAGKKIIIIIIIIIIMYTYKNDCNLIGPLSLFIVL